MFKKKKHHIFITCTPKSGSTYLLRLLEAMMSYEVRIFIAAFDQTEQDIFEPKIIKSLDINTVTHQHTRCTGHNISLLEKHQVKPIILTRYIYDSVVSMRNHMLQEPENSWWPMGYIDHNFYDLTNEKQYDFVIDLIIPWYINFYVSWQRYEKKDSLLWITYNELFSDKKGTLENIMNYYGIKKKITKNEISKCEELIKNKTRKTNKKLTENAIPLSQVQKDRIVQLTSYYKDINFNKIGL